MKFALSTFVATFLFALVATAQVGRGEADFVPTRTLIAALALTVLSTVMFLVLIDRTAKGLRVANVVQRLDTAAREVFDTVYAADPSEVADPDRTLPSLGEQPVQVVTHRGVGAVLVTLDRARLVRQARRESRGLTEARRRGPLPKAPPGLPPGAPRRPRCRRGAAPRARTR